MADNSSRRESARDSAFSFTRTIDNPTPRDPPGRSRTSMSPSTHSWVNSQLQTGPGPGPPDYPPATNPNLPPVRSPPRSPRGPLLVTNPDEDTDFSEYMNIEADVSGLAMGYKNGKPLKTQKDQGSGKQKYFGSLVKGLKKLPGTVFGRSGGSSSSRRYRRGTMDAVGTDVTGSTLPRYVSNPSSPVVAQPNSRERLRRPLPITPHPDIVDGLPAALLPGGVVRRRLPNPSFQVTPPLSDSLDTNNGTYVPPAQFPQPVIPFDGSTLTMPPPPAQPNENADAAPQLASIHSNHSHSDHHATSPHPTRIDIDDSHATLELAARSPPRRATNTTVPTVPQTVEEPPQSQEPPLASVPVRPLPTEDYRRMSKSIMNHTIASSSMSYEPSFSTELNPSNGFFRTLWQMPWVASDRVTVDYFPGMSRGAWEFRRVILGNRDSTGTAQTSKDPTGVEYKPVMKPLKSWYTGVPPVNGGAGWAKQGENKVEPAVDLLSSGTSASARSSMATSNMPGSPTPRGGRRRSSQRRDSRRLFYSPNQYTFVDVNANSTPPLRVKKKARQTTKPREKHSGRSHSHRQRERERPRHRTHNTTSAVPPVPPLPTYPHGYAPYAPTASPLYLFQPPQSLSPSNTNMDANQSHAQNPGLLSPIFMQMVPAVFTSGSIGTASPPGLAGRGAGGGYGPPGPAGNFPGGFGMSPVSESTPKPKHESL